MLKCAAPIRELLPHLRAIAEILDRADRGARDVIGDDDFFMACRTLRKLADFQRLLERSASLNN